ncbi:5'-nucleotidase domain-containing protein 1-like isoform X2 [Littorina saxatilis]
MRRHCLTALGQIPCKSEQYFNLGCRLSKTRRIASLAYCCMLPRFEVQRRPHHFVFRGLHCKTVGMAAKGSLTAKGSINFQDYDAYGFDLDHTIAKYKLVTLFNVAYDCVTNFLVNERDYDPCIKEDLLKYKDFICKGLFLDVSKGNVIKLGNDGTILKATHGTHLMSREDVQKVYGKDMQWEMTATVRKHLRNTTSEYRFFENYFDCPGLVATARIIDSIDQKNESLDLAEKEKLYSKAWKDTLDSLHNMYSPKNFSAEKGGYFQIVRNDPSRFVEECSADIKRWLKSLQQPGKIVFLLTSSQIDYAECLLEVCLGKEWQSYFDISLFHGRKPGFFTDGNPFYALEKEEETEVVTELQRNGCYSQGNIDDFNKFMAKELGKEDLKVAYFGDNICSDSYPSKHFANWGTVLVLEEMDAEGYLCSDGTVPGHEQDAEGYLCSDGTVPGHEQDAENEDTGRGVKRRKVLEHSSLVTQEEMDYMLTDFWGPFLVHREGKPKAPVEMNTFWGDVIGKYSDIAVPSLEYLAGVPLDHEFDSFCGNPKNTLGFHPGRPSSLLP